MVQMNLKKVTQTKPTVALNNLPLHVPDHISFKLVPVSQTNANHFILHNLSVVNSQPYEISTRYSNQVVNWLVK